MRAHIVVDLGFGDAGKGLLTDFLVRRFHAGLVVRYNGGAQAGHNVVTADGRHHTFSQFGAGTFIPHVRTFLSRHVVIHPTALLVEGDILRSKDVQDPFSRIRVSDKALVITPFHQALNRIRERARGMNRHGSCGVGIGETVEDSITHPESCILAGDLNDPTILRKKVLGIRERIYDEASQLIKSCLPDTETLQEYSVFEGLDVTDAWIASLSRIPGLGLVVDDSVLEQWLGDVEDAVFEGAQGVLLDGNAGFHPYTTWSDCTTYNAEELLTEMVHDAEVSKIGVLRTYAVRHGPGPLPTETEELRTVVSEHNQYNEWQGAVRYGWFDAKLARYALQVTGGVNQLMVTHTDVLPHLSEWIYCDRYENITTFVVPPFELSKAESRLTNFRVSPSISLEDRMRFSEALAGVKPIFGSCAANERAVFEKIEALLGFSVALFSNGRSAGDVRVRDCD